MQKEEMACRQTEKETKREIQIKYKRKIQKKNTSKEVEREQGIDWKEETWI